MRLLFVNNSSSSNINKLSNKNCSSILLQNIIENDDVDRCFEPPEERKETNPFDALLNEDEEEEEEEDLFLSHPVPRPLPLPLGPGMSLSFEELLQSDDRHDAILFLVALDEMMETIVKQYQTSVLGNLRQHQKNGMSRHCHRRRVDGGGRAVATNMAIINKCSKQLDMDLMVQHIHISPLPIDCTLATLVLPELTQDIMALVGEHGGANIGGVEQDISI